MNWQLYLALLLGTILGYTLACFCWTSRCAECRSDREAVTSDHAARVGNLIAAARTVIRVAAYKTEAVKALDEAVKGMEGG
jgi:uncharacterized integral membrane protein